VPLFMRWPAKVEAGTVLNDPVAHIDVMPTLAAAGGSALPEGVVIDGVNLLPAASGTGRVTRENGAIFWQSGDYQVVRAGNWKLQRGGLKGNVVMHDLASDPTEQTNLADTMPEKRAELIAMLDQHQLNRRAPVYPSVVGGSTMVDKSLADTYEEGDEYIIWSN